MSGLKVEENERFEGKGQFVQTFGWTIIKLVNLSLAAIIGRGLFE